MGKGGRFGSVEVRGGGERIGLHAYLWGGLGGFLGERAWAAVEPKWLSGMRIVIEN
jgi:hypothetical protein